MNGVIVHLLSISHTQTCFPLLHGGGVGHQKYPSVAGRSYGDRRHHEAWEVELWISTSYRYVGASAFVGS